MNFIYEKLALDKYEICYAMAIDNTTIAAMKHWAIDLVHGRRSFIVTKRLCELFFFLQEHHNLHDIHVSTNSSYVTTLQQHASLLTANAQQVRSCWI